MEYEQTHRILVRLPKGLFDRLTEQALRDRRSVNAEVVWAIEQLLEAAETKEVQPKEK